MKYGFVYIWYDRKHKRYYIGSHWGTKNDGYVCSSPWMIQAYKKRAHDFKRRIISLVYTNRKDLLEEEYYWLSMVSDEEIKNKKYYNRSKYKNGHWMSEDYESDIRKRISHSLKANTSFIEALSLRMKNRSVTDETRKKMSDSAKSRKTSEIGREKNRDHTKARWEKLTVEEKETFCKKLRKPKSGPRTEEHKQNLSLALKGKQTWLGKKHSDESKSKMRLSHLGKPPVNKGIPNDKARGTKFYNNGITQKMFMPGQQPLDWLPGRIK